MKYRVRVSERDHDITLTRNADGSYDVVARESAAPDRSLSVRATCKQHAASVTVELDGEVFDLTPHGALPHLRVVHRGFEYPVTVSAWSDEVRPRPSSIPPPKMGMVRSPIPGRVVEILVQPGQQVEQGDALVVLEAMKMQNQIFAPHDGVVERIFVAQGQTVEGAAPLVQVQP